jgi:hypothetical protein
MLTTLLLATALTIDGDLSWRNLEKLAGTSAVTCGIRVVGYRFTGRPGQSVRYGGETYKLPAEGYVELIAESRHKHFWADGQKVSIDAPNRALDQFGFQWITLPSQGEGGSGR